MELENNIKQILITLDKKTKKKNINEENNVSNNDNNNDNNNVSNNDNNNNTDKKKKMRVETKTWGLNEEDLEHKKQLDTINIIISNENNLDIEDNKYFKKYKTKILCHIKSKLQSYKQQDIIKKRIDNTKFVRLNEVLNLLQVSNLNCYDCSENVFILYEIVRESKQWSLDRINNDIGHNKGNLVISCLECNLHRRRTNKDAFYFTKNLVITREGIDY